jgi:plasmid stability protein
MATITLKNIPDDLYKQLKATAQIHHRSINSELINCLELVFRPQRLNPSEHLARIRSIRPQISTDSVSVEEIRQAIEQGRP